MSNHLLKIKLLVTKNNTMTETQALYQVLSELSKCNKEMDKQIAECIEKLNNLSSDNTLLEEKLSKCISVMSRKQLHDVGLL